MILQLIVVVVNDCKIVIQTNDFQTSQTFEKLPRSYVYAIEQLRSLSGASTERLRYAILRIYGVSSQFQSFASSALL